MRLEVGKVKVGVYVVRGEGNELAATPEQSTKEAVGVERVGEVSMERPDSYAVGATNFLHAEHDRCSRWEVSIATLKEAFGELCCTPPPRDRPHPEGVLDEDAGRVHHLWQHRW
jgi:hypothetical protein